MESNQGFADHLDQLISLFRKLRDQHKGEQLPGIDRSFFQTVDILLQNYDLIRSSVPNEMLEQLGTPIHNVIMELITQLKQDLGETGEKTDAARSIISEIETIDDMLGDKGLSSSEINELLDERSRLMNQRDNTK